jgi:hypothetical protein
VPSRVPAWPVGRSPIPLPYGTLLALIQMGAPRLASSMLLARRACPPGTPCVGPLFAGGLALEPPRRRPVGDPGRAAPSPPAARSGTAGRNAPKARRRPCLIARTCSVTRAMAEIFPAHRPWIHPYICCGAALVRNPNGRTKATLGALGAGLAHIPGKCVGVALRFPLPSSHNIQSDRISPVRVGSISAALVA